MLFVVKPSPLGWYVSFADAIVDGTGRRWSFDDNVTRPWLYASREVAQSAAERFNKKIKVFV